MMTFIPAPNKKPYIASAKYFVNQAEIIISAAKTPKIKNVTIRSAVQGKDSKFLALKKTAPQHITRLLRKKIILRGLKLYFNNP